jgi:energy-coupling factor transporter ATP-binding protein EcfA2
VVGEHAVVVDRLRVVRGSRVALDGISVAVGRGVVTGLLGPSGSGKSTLMRAVVGVQRIAAGEVVDQLESPVAGIVREVRPGIGIGLRSPARGIRGALVLGGPARGRLELATEAEGELRASAIDVGQAGTILVVGARVDAEALTRARAMGIRGMVVAGLASKERRDFAASERRQSSAIHRLPPFAVLVLDGTVRRPIASPIMALLTALAGRDVAIVADPPLLLADDPYFELPAPAADLIRVRNGPLMGLEGRWEGLAGPRRFAAGVHLEAGLIRVGDGSPIVVPLGDLERFV